MSTLPIPTSPHLPTPPPSLFPLLFNSGGFWNEKPAWKWLIRAAVTSASKSDDAEGKWQIRVENVPFISESIWRSFDQIEFRNRNPIFPPRKAGHQCANHAPLWNLIVLKLITPNKDRRSLFYEMNNGAKITLSSDKPTHRFAQTLRYLQRYALPLSKIKG